MHNSTEFNYIVEGRFDGKEFKASGHNGPQCRTFHYCLAVKGRGIVLAGVTDVIGNPTDILLTAVEDWFTKGKTDL